MSEIEQAVSKMLEQDDFDAVDYGGPIRPTQRRRQQLPSDVPPYPEGAETQWFGVFHLFDVEGNRIRRVTGTFDTEDVFAAGALLYAAADSLPATAAQAVTDVLNIWKSGEDEPYGYHTLMGNPFTDVDREGADTIGVRAEEWSAGVGRSAEDAERMFAAVEPGGDEGWDEI